MAYRKNIIVIVCAVAVLMPGCRKKDTPQGGPAPEPDRTKAPAGTQTAAQDELLAVELGVGIGPVSFGMTKEQVIEHFGEPDRIDGDGASLSYVASKGLGFMVDSSQGLRSIDCWAKEALPPGTKVTDFAGSTKEGIAMGASREEIASAYGQPDRATDAGSMTILHYNKLRCFFTLKTDRLVKLSMTVPR